MKPSILFAAIAAAATIAVPAMAQRPMPSPEQRIDRLERQVNEMQRRVFPKGRPADTAGFLDEPAATQSSVATLDQRLDSLEQQMTNLLRQSEENGHQLQQMQSDIARARTDQEQRLSTLEQRVSDAAAAAAAAPAPEPAPAATKPAAGKPTGGKAAAKPVAAAPADESPAAADAATDPGEDAYSQGFHQWQAGQYDDAIGTLRAFTAAYPKHRRVSYANNLIGRALLDKGDSRAAAEALLANYRNNPKGDRAPDSLYYLGQALMKLVSRDRRARPILSSTPSMARRFAPTFASRSTTPRPRLSAAEALNCHCEERSDAAIQCWIASLRSQ